MMQKMTDRNMPMKKSAFILLLAASAALSACGRRGPLEAPSAAANPPVNGEKQAVEPAEDKPFVLDGLIK